MAMSALVGPPNSTTGKGKGRQLERRLPLLPPGPTSILPTSLHAPGVGSLHRRPSLTWHQTSRCPTSHEPHTASELLLLLQAALERPAERHCADTRVADAGAAGPRRASVQRRELPDRVSNDQQCCRGRELTPLRHRGTVKSESPDTSADLCEFAQSYIDA